ncbi:MAG: lysophospholipid acyltransferase family protein [Deltaproteobacteria bacterium]|jgi:predicted LPLAT superfamily acyltransferase|nr:lysophospholipid acyltransferase family protein [Deltaproteobacteria bacterium]
MKDRFYHLLMILSKGAGIWLFRLVAWIIATGYFCLFPSRVAVSVRFYAALFPDRRRIGHLCCAWRQFHEFTDVFLDRFLQNEAYPMYFTHEGWEYLENAVKQRTGGILLMSHLGSWELAAHRLLQSHGRDLPEMKLLLYMGRKHKEQIEHRQKQDLAARGIKIVTVEKEGNAPIDILEGINFLKSGGIVSLTGDRSWRKDQRVVPVRFLGHEVFLPESPFVFALLSRTPLLIFFATRVGRFAYHCQVLTPVYVEAKNRKDRQRAIREAAQTYIDGLERVVRQHPYAWFHFEPFLGRKLEE